MADFYDVNGDAALLSEGRQRTTSTGRTFLNLLKSYLGSGILGLPWALTKSGLYGGIVCLALCGIMCMHTMILLTRCKNMLIKKGVEVVSYSDIGAYVYGERMRKAIDVFLVVAQFGVCTVYLVYVSSQASSIFSNASSQVGQVYILLIALPLFVGFAYIRTLKWIALVSAISTCCMITSLIIILVADFIQIHDDAVPGHAKNIDYAIQWSSIVTTFASCTYAYEGIALVLPSETAMIQPELFPTVIISVLFLSGLNYSFFALAGYIAFGVDTDSQIIDNIGDFADDYKGGSDTWDGLQLFVKTALVIAIGLSYPLQLFPVTDILEEFFIPLKKDTPLLGDEREENDYAINNPAPVSLDPKRPVKQIFIRTGLVLFGMALAVAIPDFGDLMGLVGSLGMASLQFVFPPMLYVKVCSEVGINLTIAEKIPLAIYILIGAITAVFGTATAIINLFDL